MSGLFGNICTKHGETVPCLKCRDEKDVALSQKLDQLAAGIRLLADLQRVDKRVDLADLLEESVTALSLVAESLVAS